MDENKKYQAYYTKSEPILNYMAKMLNISPQDSILEPCGGDGVFVDKILEQNPNATINILELNPDSIKVLEQKYNESSNIEIRHTDTLLDFDIVNSTIKYDKIIGNPPYGARNDDEKKNLLKKIYSELYTKESYTLFLYACIKCLKEEGMLSFIIPDTFLSLHRHEGLRKFLLANTKINEIALFPSSFFPGVNFGYANLCIITLTKSSNIFNNMSNVINIRTGYKCVDELNLPNSGQQKSFKQKEVSETIGSAFMFNSDEKISRIINDSSILRIGDIANCVTGFYSGNDKKYLRPLNKEVKNASKYVCVLPNTVRSGHLSDEEKINGITSEDCFVPIVKGGNKEYLKPDEWFMDWSSKSISEYKQSKKCRFQNPSYYFTTGIAIPMIRSGKLTASLIDKKLFDQSIVGVFPKDCKYTKYLLAYFNSMVCSDFVKAINPSTNNSANYIKKIPFVEPDAKTMDEIDNITDCIIKNIKEGNNDIQFYKNRIDTIFNDLYLNIGNKPAVKKTTVKQLNLFDTQYSVAIV